jgi:hypothetical protein
MRKLQACALVLALALALGPAPLLAADWRFDPVVTLEGQYTDNVALGQRGAGGLGEEEGDTVIQTSVRLALRRTTPRSGLIFSYTPRRETFTDNSDFDNTSHRAGLTGNFEQGPRLRWEASGRYALTERPIVELEEDPFAIEPLLGVTRVESASGTLRSFWTATERQRWVFLGELRSIEYDDVDASLDQRELRNTTHGSAEAAWEMDLSAFSTAGVSYRYSRIDENRRGTWDVHDVLGGWTWGTPERLQVTASAGVAFIEIQEEGTFGSGDPGTRFTGSAAVDRRLGRRGSLTASVSHDVGGSRGTLGLAATTSADVRLGVSIGEFSRLSGAVRWAQRQSVDAEGDIVEDRDISTLGYRLEHVWGFGPRWSAVFGMDYIRQDSGLGQLLERDRMLFSAGIRWSPMAQRR